MFSLMLDLLHFAIMWHIWLLQTHYMLDYPVGHYPSLHWWKHAVVMTGYILNVCGVNVCSQHFTGQQQLNTQMLFQWKIGMNIHQSIAYYWHLQERIDLMLFSGCSWRERQKTCWCPVLWNISRILIFPSYLSICVVLYGLMAREAKQSHDLPFTWHTA